LKIGSLRSLTLKSGQKKKPRLFHNNLGFGFLTNLLSTIHYSFSGCKITMKYLMLYHFNAKILRKRLHKPNIIVNFAMYLAERSRSTAIQLIIDYLL